jgi:hypothetical protein
MILLQVSAALRVAVSGVCTTCMYDAVDMQSSLQETTGACCYNHSRGALIYIHLPAMLFNDSHAPMPPLYLLHHKCMLHTPPTYDTPASVHAMLQSNCDGTACSPHSV